MRDCTYCLNHRYLQNAAGEYVRCPGCPAFVPMPREKFEERILAAVRAIEARLGGKTNERKAL